MRSFHIIDRDVETVRCPTMMHEPWQVITCQCAMTEGGIPVFEEY